tara:strand:+ start:635 stop:1402 length:768 start_codon:yes stop_codon:yes gene_type:complete
MVLKGRENLICRIFLIILFISVSLCESNEVGYFGGWPINKDKDKISNPGFEFKCLEGLDKKELGCSCSSDEECVSGDCFNSPRVGKYCMQSKGTIFPRYNLIDQYGESIDIYDFAGHEKLIVIEFSTSWCQPCRELASWFSYGDTYITKNKRWKAEYNIIKDLVHNDRIYFINIQTQDKYREPASLFSVEDWFQEYPDEKIPILADSSYNVRDWVRVTGYPTVIVLNDKMEIVQFSIRGWHDAFNFLSDIDWSLN